MTQIQHAFLINRHDMKNLIILLLIAALPFLGGCATASLVTDARGEKCIDENGNVVQVTSRPKPALYLLTPLTAAYDVASTPFGLATWCATGVDPFWEMFDPQEH